MRVYFPDAFPKAAFDRAAEAGISSTGVVEGVVPEQALAIETSEGAARVRYLLGGFHMPEDPPARAAETVKNMQAAGVEAGVRGALRGGSGDRAVPPDLRRAVSGCGRGPAVSPGLSRATRACSDRRTV
jgi:hypothetical protein